jgi:hypothetical protein
MSTYTALTPQQFKSARDAGFSVDKIIKHEQTRKAQATPAGQFDVPSKQQQPQVVDHQALLASLKEKAPKLAEDAAARASLFASGRGLIDQTAYDIGDIATQSEQGLGKTIGNTLAVNTGVTDTANQISEDSRKMGVAFLRHISEDSSMGRDTTRLKQAYNKWRQTTPDVQGILPELPTTEQAGGQLLGTALDVLTIGTYGKAAQGMTTAELASKTPSIATGVESLAIKPKGLLTKEGAGRVGAGGAIGYGYDVSQGLQGNRGEDRTGANALMPGMGTVIGTSLPALSGAAQSTKSAVNLDRHINELEQGYKDLASGTKSGKINVSKIDAKTAAMNKSGTTGKTPERVLAEARIIPKHTGTKLDTVEQAAEYKNSIKPLFEANTAALKEVGMSTTPVSLDTIEQDAISRARNAGKVGTHQETMIANIEKEFEALRKQNPSGSMSIGNIDNTKSAYWDSIFGNKSTLESDKLKGDSDYYIAKSMQKTIENVARDAGHEDVAQLNREIGDRLGAAKFLASLDGTTIKGGRLLKYATSLVGASMGNSIPAKILGAIGGNLVGDMLISANVSSPIKRLILRNMQIKDPAAYLATVKWLEKQNLDRETRLLLPAPAELGSAKNPIIPPAPTTYEPRTKQQYSQQIEDFLNSGENVPLRDHRSGVDEKTINEFFRTSSEANPKTIYDTIYELQLDAEIQKEVLDNNSAKELLKYTNKRTGELPQVTGQKFDYRGKRRDPRVVKSQYGVKGDDLMSELGYSDTEEAARALEQYQAQRERYNNTLSAIQHYKAIAKERGIPNPYAQLKSPAKKQTTAVMMMVANISPNTTTFSPEVQRLINMSK